MEPTVFIIRVRGIPKAQPRARAFSFKGQGGKYMARMYDAGTAEAWKSDVAAAFRDVLPAEPYDCPIRVDVDFFLPRPARLKRKKDLDRPIPMTSKPDRDNLDKAPLDALTRLGLWTDDCLVFAGWVRKWYASKHGATGAVYRITINPAWEEWPLLGEP